MIKNILRIGISLLLCVSFVIPVKAWDSTGEFISIVDDFQKNTMSYQYDKRGILQINGKGILYSYDRDFANNYSVGKLIIGEGITKLWGFNNCDELSEVQLPSTIKELGTDSTPYGEQMYEGAFSYCENLQKINFPAGLQKIHSESFARSRLKEVTLPNSVVEVGENAFICNYELEKIKFSDSMDTIRKGMLIDAHKLNTVQLPNKLKSIEARAFTNCTSLRNMTLPETLEEIGNYAFALDKNLKSITIPQSVTTIGNKAFGYYVEDKDLQENEDWKVEDLTHKVSGFTMNVYKNSAGERYAKQNGFKYNIIGISDKENPEVSITDIKLDRTSLQLNVGEKGWLNVTIVPSHTTDSKEVRWTSSNENVAKVSGGEITALNPGEAVITARTVNNKVATCRVHVDLPIESITLNADKITLHKGESKKLIATIFPYNATTDKTLRWETSNKDVASVEDGVITGINVGESYITAYSKNGEYARCRVEVKEAKVVNPLNVKLNKTSLTILKGQSIKLTATISPSQATNKKVTWSTSNKAIATVSNGTVKEIKAGTVTITVKTANGKKATCKVTVKNPVKIKSVSLNKKKATIKVKKTIKLTAKINPSNTTDSKKLTWSTSNKKIATVSNGTVKGVKKGKVTITVKTSNGKTAKATITVK